MKIGLILFRMNRPEVIEIKNASHYLIYRGKAGESRKSNFLPA
jgi:hypothetical protein